MHASAGKRVFHWVVDQVGKCSITLYRDGRIPRDFQDLTPFLNQNSRSAADSGSSEPRTHG